ncbi:hypothetical protein EIB75_12525 [Epilithonimonas vandammei]|jgi:hypothetical protein|uniref:Uncharacterized protein n=2 Tax=Flavobacteriales TaxID=200644 RepID=A0A2U8QT18_9FLAO|nr:MULTISPECIES: hypothetical protein [Bacteroidota]MBF01271.1 hypothetical protein [Flavobacterium sp.]HBI89094.1 hypothetical protein [Sphingobacterium sp.]AWM13317.1 hypothetical protein DI487_05210 [Flavobacterium sediminis]AZI56039.1 hypothetical protein EIB75_12525 [Epilithonimonas vandammei]MBS5795410.1 hypothetical protein [Dysgonomonas mossii]|tara:strand:+ start:48579 stop:49745 length:1167 start_codon:yes stop_codon:yes gene_type:complete
MNYATQQNIGNNPYTRTAKATEVAPTVGRVRTMDAKTKRRRPSTKRQTEIRTDSNATNGFLKCTFLPKLKTAQSVQACKKSERDFYQSLSKLAEHYSIEPMPTQQDYGYPYNMVLAMWDMDTKMKRSLRNWDGFKLILDSKKTFLTSEERYDTGTTLFYIPIVPLFEMLHDKQRKHTAHLLTSVCSYLYHIARIPYYRQEDSYLYWLYETHKDWIDNDDETEETESYKNELRKAETIGDKIEQKLYNRINLTVFEQRLSRFKSRDTFDHECWNVACNAFALYTEYPTASIFRNAPMPEQDPYTDDCENEVIGMEKYISFIADTKGWLYESVKDSINNEFNECGVLEEPTISKAFDGKKISVGNLDFENRMFELLDDLSYLLNNYKTTE